MKVVRSCYDLCTSSGLDLSTSVDDKSGNIRRVDG